MRSGPCDSLALHGARKTGGGYDSEVEKANEWVQTRDAGNFVSRGNAVLLNNDAKALAATFMFIQTFLHQATPRPSTSLTFLQHPSPRELGPRTYQNTVPYTEPFIPAVCFAEVLSSPICVHPASDLRRVSVGFP